MKMKYYKKIEYLLIPLIVFSLLVNTFAVLIVEASNDINILQNSKIWDGNEWVNVWDDLSCNTGYYNCYAYAINNQIRDNGSIWFKQQPGEYANVDYHEIGIPSAVTKDFSRFNSIDTPVLFYSVGRYETCQSGAYKVALVISPDSYYHWYRQDSDGLWSHKQGTTPVTREDSSGNLIIDPQTANRGIYTEFVGYFTVKPWNRYYTSNLSTLSNEVRAPKQMINS